MQDIIIRVLLLLAVFASVFLLSQLALDAGWRNRARFAAVNKRLRMIREGAAREEIVAQLRKNAPAQFRNMPPFVANRLRSFQRMLLATSLPYTVQQVVFAMAVLFLIVLVALLFGAVLGGFALGLGTVLLCVALAICAALALPIIVMSMIAERRRKKIAQQFPVALDIFVRALRSGHPISSAIDLLTKEMEDPIGSEFGLVADEVSYGAELTDALEAMAERWDQEDMRMFVISLSVQNETGGNLAEILENLSHVIRARAHLFMQVRALSSEGRMTGWILTILPIFTFVALFLIEPGFYLDVSRDPIFLIGFPSLILLYLLGVYVIRRMIDLKV